MEHAGRKLIILIGPMEIGGAERQALALAVGLRDRHGWNVEVWGTFGKGGRASEFCEANGIPWRIVTPGFYGRPRGCRNSYRTYKKLRALARELHEAQPEVLMPFMTIPCVNTALVWRKTGARAIIWQQRNSTSEVDWLPVERMAASRVSAFISNSHGGAELLRSRLDVSPEKITVIPNGIVRDEPMSTRSEWRAQLGVRSDAIVATMVANLHVAKDHETLLRAWSIVQQHVADRGVDVVLALAGRYDDTHESVVALADELGIQDSVRLLGEVRDVSGLLDASDICVLSTFREGLPNGVLEGMAAGLPVVASVVDGVREAVGEAGLEWLFPVQDSVAASVRLLALIDDSDTRIDFGNRMRVRAATEFSLERMIDRTALVIDEVNDAGIR